MSTVKSGAFYLFGYALIWHTRKYWHNDTLGFDDRGDLVIPVKNKRTLRLWIEKT